MHPAAAAPPPSPLRYTIDPSARLVVVELCSVDDGPALLTALGEIRADPLFRPSYHVCVDCNGLRAIPSCEDVKRLARLCVACPRVNAPSHWALLATWRPINEAARFFATAVSAPNVTLRVFQTWSDARVWFATTRPDEEESSWIGPSRALNEIIGRSKVIGR
jgi:hypothetical protein